MAGYMKTQYGNIYEGRYENGAGAPVTNGILMLLDNTTMKFVLPTADTTSKFLCIDTCTVGELPGYEFLVDSIASGKRYYFVQNCLGGNESVNYDTLADSIPAGELLSAHPIQVNDTFVATTSRECVVGTKYGVLATGMIG